MTVELFWGWKNIHKHVFPKNFVDDVFFVFFLFPARTVDFHRLTFKWEPDIKNTFPFEFFKHQSWLSKTDHLLQKNTIPAVQIMFMFTRTWSGTMSTTSFFRRMAASSNNLKYTPSFCSHGPSPRNPFAWTNDTFCGAVASLLGRKVGVSWCNTRKYSWQKINKQYKILMRNFAGWSRNFVTQHQFTYVIYTSLTDGDGRGKSKMACKSRESVVYA